MDNKNIGWCAGKTQAGIKRYCVFVSLLLTVLTTQAQSISLKSPDERLHVTLERTDTVNGVWGLRADWVNDRHVTANVFTAVLGLRREDADFSRHLTLQHTGRPKRITESYTALHGKSAVREKEGHEVLAQFRAASGEEMVVMVRAYNDGIAFRYVFPEKKKGRYYMEMENTAYHFLPGSTRWLQRFVTSYEDFYPVQEGGKPVKGKWNYPALVHNGGDDTWALFTEAGLDSFYCATKISNEQHADQYRLLFPLAAEGNGTGEVRPSFALPWKSPWRVVMVGNLHTIVESTLVEDVSAPTSLKQTAWIRPGISSWVYWASNHGTMDFQQLKAYTDLAARMGWAYTLFDWEWDVMSNGGGLEDAVKYARSKGVKPMIWYNSGGAHNQVSATPRDRLITHEARVKEFDWLKKIGVYGIKVDFFESDKQQIIKYYIDILADAAQAGLMVNFHGATLPRGWSRTYPNLMSVEGVWGAEQYNNGKEMTTRAAAHNATLPFTRNVVGPMDYTPVTFTNSQHPHTTTFAHELALSVVFESGIQHFADRPEGYDALPDAPKQFLRNVPAAWDKTRLLDGFPGQRVVLAREKSAVWYIGGINGEGKAGEVHLPLRFLPAGHQFRLTVISDGNDDHSFDTKERVVNSNDTLAVKWLPAGGFVAVISRDR